MWKPLFARKFFIYLKYKKYFTHRFDKYVMGKICILRVHLSILYWISFFVYIIVSQYKPAHWPDG